VFKPVLSSQASRSRRSAANSACTEQHQRGGAQPGRARAAPPGRATGRTTGEPAGADRAGAARKGVLRPRLVEGQPVGDGAAEPRTAGGHEAWPRTPCRRSTRSSTPGGRRPAPPLTTAAPGIPGTAFRRCPRVPGSSPEFICAAQAAYGTTANGSGPARKGCDGGQDAGQEPPPRPASIRGMSRCRHAQGVDWPRGRQRQNWVSCSARALPWS
jgi:hypothetical protein